MLNTLLVVSLFSYTSNEFCDDVFSKFKFHSYDKMHLSKITKLSVVIFRSHILLFLFFKIIKSLSFDCLDLNINKENVNKKY